MGKRRQRLASGGGGLLAILVVTWLAASWHTEIGLVHPARASITPNPSHWGIPYENVTFTTSDGVRLRGWWVAGQQFRGTVVLLHGYRDSRADAFKIAGPFLHRAGYNVLAFDFRAEGTSDGSAVTVGHEEPKDARAAVALAQRQAPGQPIVLMGFSLGAGVALEAAPDLPVNAVIEDSGWTTLDAVLRVSFEKFAHVPSWLFEPPVVAIGQAELGFRVTDVRPIDSASRIHEPTLAIIGDADVVIPPDQGRRIYALLPGPKQLLEVPGAGHVKAHDVAPSLYEQTVLAFLAQNLPPPAFPDT